MDNLKVGEYVRTTDGIFEVTKIDGLYIYLDKEYFDKQYQTMRDVTFKERILKHSFNIIDLIEVNDFVNGHRVANIKNDEGRIEIGLETDHMINYYIEKEDIKTILTYEQHERNFYRLD